MVGWAHDDCGSEEGCSGAADFGGAGGASGSGRARSLREERLGDFGMGSWVD